MNTTSRLPRLLGVVALAGALVFAAACGDNGDGEDGADGENGGAPTVTTTTTPPNGGDTATPTETADGGAGGGGEAVAVSLTDFAIDMPGSVSAGDTTFEVTNDGGTEHDFIVIATDMAPDALPVDGAQVALDELDVVEETTSIPSGETSEAEASLDAGAYVVICNVAGHYELGMRTALTAE
ncbi:MAG: hypothetical protein GEU80_03470 [Dehalococcoidia bacterium]|nr:hypothetical protein [Dehalococcoidia bacterium]